MADRDDEGKKTRFFGGTTDRASAYRSWRYTLGGGMYVLDVDQVEWRQIDGVVLPVAVIELTRRDDPEPMDDVYLETILERYDDEFQGYHSVYIAQKLAVFAYIVVFREDLSEAWVYNLSLAKGWRNMGWTAYEDWIKNLRPPKAENILRLMP